MCWSCSMISARETTTQDEEEGREEGAAWSMLCSKLRCTSLNRFLANGTYDIEMRRGKDGDVHVCKDTHDSWRKDKLITCSYVMLVVYDRLYHMWRKVYGKTFHKGKKKMSTRLSDSVIVWPWSENKGHHHVKEPWSLSELNCGEIKCTSPQYGLLTEEWGQLVSRDGSETRMTRVILTIYPRDM